MNSIRRTWNAAAAVSVIISGVQNMISILGGLDFVKILVMKFFSATGKDDFKPVPGQGVVKCEVISEVS